MAEERKVKKFSIIMDADLHTDMKLTAVKQGVTMNQFIVDLIAKELERIKNEEQ